MSLLRWTGIPAALSFYRYFAFNLPRSTLAAALGLLVALGLVEGYLAATSVRDSVALAVVSGLLAAGALFATVALPLGGGWSWVLGSLVSAAALGAWILTRLVDVAALRNSGQGWDNPAGTVSMGAAALFIALHLSVATGMNVAAPDRTRWED